jgi:hypothetical protein
MIELAHPLHDEMVLHTPLAYCNYQRANSIATASHLQAVASHSCRAHAVETTSRVDTLMCARILSGAFINVFRTAT